MLKDSIIDWFRRKKNGRKKKVKKVPLLQISFHYIYCSVNRKFRKIDEMPFEMKIPNNEMHLS